MDSLTPLTLAPRSGSVDPLLPPRGNALRRRSLREYDESEVSLTPHANEMGLFIETSAPAPL